ncbi:MAG: hypothetical protein ACP5PW_01535 [Candidatus Dormibacteria bacterium]
MATAPRKSRPRAAARSAGALPHGLTAQQCRDMYRKMVQIRHFEDHAAEAYAQAKVGGFLHLYIGEEAVAVGGCSPR